MPKISPQSKSFIILFCLALFGTFLCLIMWPDFYPGSYSSYNLDRYQTHKNSENQALGAQPIFKDTLPPVDTSAWKTYSDSVSGLSFKYNPDWTVKPIIEKSGYRVIEVDPGKKYYNIKIYMSPENFFVMDGLPTTQETIGGKTALNVNNLLYGIKTGSTYFTFDVGLSLSLTPGFNALVHSATFAN